MPGIQIQTGRSPIGHKRPNPSGTLRGLDVACAGFERQLKERGYLATGGQIFDATLVAAPKQRNTEPEKGAIKEGKTAVEILPD